MQDKNDLERIYDVTLFNINDLDVLLHESLKHARELLSAQAGTIYIKENKYLKFHVFQNDSMSYENIYINYYSVKDLKLSLDEKNKYLSVDAFLTKKIIMINDIYSSSKYDFVGTKEFDIRFDYKTISVLSVPLIHPINNECLGVIQLLNKIVDNKVLPFDLKDKEIISMLSSFMALSISKAQEDVVKLKEVNEKLIKANESLEKRVQEEVSLNQQKSAIIFHQSKMASMGEMLSNIAHQWRQPLSTISTLASGLSLELEYDKLSKKDAMGQLRKIVLTTQNLSKTIDDFKGFYNLESIKEEFTLKSVIDKSLELAEVVLSHNKINIICNIDESITLYGLKNEFTQAFLNILTTVKDNLLKDILSNDVRYIFINIFKENDKKYIKILDNSIHVVNFDDNYKQYTNFNMGIYMTKLIIQKHFHGDIYHKNIEYEYEHESLKGGEYTIVLS
jgi:signal transduction histidine kinase